MPFSCVEAIDRMFCMHMHVHSEPLQLITMLPRQVLDEWTEEIWNQIR